MTKCDIGDERGEQIQRDIELHSNQIGQVFQIVNVLIDASKCSNLTIRNLQEEVQDQDHERLHKLTHSESL